MEIVRHAGRAMMTIAAASASVLSGGVAEAATATWYNAQAYHAKTYYEGTVYNSRTGIDAGFTDWSANGQARITVWYGSYYNQCWATLCSISGPRTYDKGKFRWDMPGGVSSDHIGVRARALNVGSLGLVAPRDETAEGEATSAASIDVPPAVAELAASYGVSQDRVVHLGSRGKSGAWRAAYDGATYLFVTDARGVVSAAAVNDTAFEKSGLAISRNGQQYLLVPQSVDAGVSRRVAGLTRIAPGLFASTRASGTSSISTYAVELPGRRGHFDVTLLPRRP